MLQINMSDKESQLGGGSPAPLQKDVDTKQKDGENSESSVPKSVQEVLSRNSGHDIAMKALAANHDYSKAKTMAHLKSFLAERDSDLVMISKKFLDQEKRIKVLRQQVAGKNREVAQLRQDAKSSADRAIRYADALIDSVNKPSEPMSPSVPTVPDETPSPEDTTGAPDTGEGNGAPSTEPEPGQSKEPTSVFAHQEYKDKIREIDLDGLDMTQEADAMTKPEECEINEDEPYRYEVPMQLMGMLIGRQKVTLNRIINQTATEIEPKSWVVEGRRVMGFELLGSQESIRKAITAMIRTVRLMDKTRAKRIISAHIKTAEKKDSSRPEPSKPKPPGSKFKSKKICIDFTKGKCTYGEKCKFQHKKGSK